MLKLSKSQKKVFSINQLFTYVIADQAEVSIRRNKGEDPVRLPPLVPAQEYQAAHHPSSISHIFYSQKLPFVITNIFL
jgi:hypothetical protein